MRIDAYDTIAGLPAAEARAIARHAAQPEPLTRGELATSFRWPPRLTGSVFKALAREGYVERVGPRARAWILTGRDHALKMATAAKPIRRATADRLAAEVTARARALADWAARRPSALGCV
jgi:hypothetical protein